MDFDSETWVAIASAFIAICALGVTVWQGQQNYKHNKLSVRPKLTTMEYYDDNGKTKTVSFDLINAGLGPAIIKDFILVYDGKEISKNNRKRYDDFLRNKVRSFTNTTIVSFAPGSSLIMHERCTLFSFCCKSDQDTSFTRKLNLRVNYQSIYEDQIFEYDTKKDHQLQEKKLI